MLPIQRPTPAPAPWADGYLTIGITGTNGKTTSVHLAAHAIRAAGHSVLVESTLGYALNDIPIEVPRTVPGFLHALQTSQNEGCQHACIEVTSEALANGFAKRWRFDIGVFSNLTRDHLDAHGSFEHYLASKAQLFVHLGPGRCAVLNACDEAALIINRVIPPDVRRLWYASPSRGPTLCTADLQALDVSLSLEGTHVKLAPSDLASRLGGSLFIKSIGSHFAENALASACATIEAGIPPKSVAEGLACCPTVPGRFEVLVRSPTIVVDYAHSPDALERTCGTARSLATAGKLIVVFGAGGGRDTGKREAMGRAVGERADTAIITTDNPRFEDPQAIARALAAGCRRGGRAYTLEEPDRKRAIERALDLAHPNDIIVIAGKGHERGQLIGKSVIPFSDVDTVKQLVNGSSASI